MDHMEFDVEHVNDEQFEKVEAEIASEKSLLASMSRDDEDLF